MNAELPDFGTPDAPNEEVSLDTLNAVVQEQVQALNGALSFSFETLRAQHWEIHKQRMQVADSEHLQKEADGELRVRLLILLQRIGESRANPDPPFYLQSTP